jgi:hypothetical protein
MGEWSWGQISWDRNSTFSGDQSINHEVEIPNNYSISWSQHSSWDRNPLIMLFNAFKSFDLMIVLEANKSIMRSKFKKALLRNFDLMIDLLASSAIMRSNDFMHRWLIIRAKK